MADPLWTSSEISAATGGKETVAFDVGGLSIDTRTLQAGDLFVALTDQRDGHDFVPAAFGAGAAGALVSKAVEGGPYVEVASVLPALEQLGLAARDRAKDCYRVAVTGSVGKTSVKEMLARIFRGFGSAHWNVKSFNNHWGVPLTLARMPRETERAVFEIGMNTPGEIAPRSEMVSPHVAMVTKIAPAHLEGMGSIEGVAEEKSAVFTGLLPGGIAIIPAEDAFADFLEARAKSSQPDCRILRFGLSNGVAAQVVSSVLEGEETKSTIRVHGVDVSVTLNAVGDHWALNAALALLAACPTPDDDVERAAQLLSGYTPPPGRGVAETLPLPSGGSFTLIDDAYNANPESMRAALAGFGSRHCTGRRIVVLGEMLEVGDGAYTEHKNLSAPVLSSCTDEVFLSGQLMQCLKGELDRKVRTHWAENADKLYSDIILTLKPGDLVLLKGSNASGVGRLADRLRQWSKTAAEKVMSADLEKVDGGMDAV